MDGRSAVLNRWICENTPPTPRRGHDMYPNKIVMVQFVSVFTCITAHFSNTDAIQQFLNTSGKNSHHYQHYTSTAFSQSKSPQEVLPYIVALWLARKAGMSWVYDYINTHLCTRPAHAPWTTKPLASPFEFIDQCKLALISVQFTTYGEFVHLKRPKMSSLKAVRTIVNYTPDDSEERYYTDYAAIERAKNGDPSAHRMDYIDLDDKLVRPYAYE